MEKLLLETPSIVVADEAHTFKNATAKVHQACARFKTGSRIALTGTPLANNVDEYYSMINWVAPNFLGPSKEFNQIYSNPIQVGLDVDSGPGEKREALKMMEVLKRTVAPKVNRAGISCIKSDLPPKYEFVLFVPPTQLQKKLYNMYMGYLDGQPSQARIFGIVNDLTLICNHPRCMRDNAEEIVRRAKKNARSDNGSEEPSSVSEEMASMILKETNSRDMNLPDLSRKVELLLLILEEVRQLNEKVLVFSQSIRTLNYLENLLKMQKRLVLRLDGDTKMGVRQEMVKNFNKGQYEVYLISTRAGGMGLNIQGANRVVIFDAKWNPVVEQQAVGRAYRIGQEKTVYVYYLLVAGSVEEVLHKKGVFKTQLASRLIDKKNPVNWGKRVGAFGLIKSRPPQPLDGFLKRDGILDKLIRYKPGGEAINRIVSTDTFEEEDSSSKVTPDMNIQIEEFMKMENIRRTNPASPSSSASKENFELKLAHKLGQAQNIATLGLAEASSQAARSITAAISDVLKQQAQGVLYDISRWSLLNRLSDDDRFVLASASGLLRPDILASVRAEELERRAKSLNSLSQQQFEEQMQRLRVSDHSGRSMKS
ncbi:Helicase ARIP4 [Escovopsis weberi]|uniref:Helicase ARIP4 n=1 Tax=Escovopsis weberi TaxID=150374 RepID=A0A0M9VS91_ESCWE|nr:Helicase ARIP4 [Escovopsis weberi]